MIISLTSPLNSEVLGIWTLDSIDTESILEELIAVQYVQNARPRRGDGSQATLGSPAREFSAAKAPGSLAGGTAPGPTGTNADRRAS